LKDGTIYIELFLVKSVIHCL